jgi:hypothetical protein
MKTLNEKQWIKELFEYESCAECGGDESEHNVIEVMGNLFAVCTRTEHLTELE